MSSQEPDDAVQRQKRPATPPAAAAVTKKARPPPPSPAPQSPCWLGPADASPADARRAQLASPARSPAAAAASPLAAAGSREARAAAIRSEIEQGGQQEDSIWLQVKPVTTKTLCKGCGDCSAGGTSQRQWPKEHFVVPGKPHLLLKLELHTQ